MMVPLSKELPVGMKNVQEDQNEKHKWDRYVI